MAKLLALIQKLPANKLRTPHHIALSSKSLFCTTTSCNVEEDPHNVQLNKLRALLQRRDTHSAKTFIKTLLQSHSPANLYSLFPVDTTKPTFSNLLLSVCTADSKLVNEAVDLYNSIKKDGNFPSLPSFNLLLESLVLSGEYRQTLDLFNDALNLGIRVDKFAYGKAVQSAVKLGDLNGGMELLNRMKNNRGVGGTNFVYNVLIGGLVKERRIEGARKLFDEMFERRVLRNRVTYNTVIDGYCKMGNLDEAFRVRELMKMDKVEENVVTFNSLLSGLCRGKRMEDAMNLLVEMEHCGFVPDGYSYSVDFDGHSRCGNGDASFVLFEEVIRKGVRLNNYTCSTLLNGLCKSGKVDKAEEVLLKSMEDGFAPDEVSMQNFKKLIFTNIYHVIDSK